MASAEIIDKVTYAFNKFFGGFVRDVKEINEELHNSIKQNYKVIDKSSDNYLDYFWNTLGNELQSKDFDIIENADRLYVAKDILLRQVLLALGEKDEDPTNILNTIFTMGVFAYIKKQVLEDDIDTYFDTSLRALTALQKGDKDAYDDEVDDILDENLKAIFDRLMIVYETVESSNEDNVEKKSEKKSEDPQEPVNDDAINEIFEKFGNSKICDIAKEVSKSIDIGDLKVNSPSDIFNMLDFSKGGNNILGNIMQQVTSTISSKVSNGELKQEDLIQEAMTMMGSLGKMGGAANIFNNPMLGSLMNNMSGGGKGKAGIRTDLINKMATKDRLKKKLDLRRGSQNK
jgi:hypothetical protein